MVGASYGHNFLLTQRTRLSGSFRYLKHVRQANRKFSRVLWKKVSAPKMGVCQNIPTRFWDSFFQNLNFFHFSWHKIWLVRRAVTILLLTQRTRLGGPFRYLEHVRKANKKFLEAFEKRFQPKIWVRNEVQNQVGKFWQNLMFWAETFSKMSWNFFKNATVKQNNWPLYMHQESLQFKRF